MQYSACRMCISFVFISHCTCRCSVCSVEHLITKHVISMAPASETVTQPKLLTFQEKLDVINKVVTADGAKTSLTNLVLLYHL
jgi:hypothetical protein